MVHQSSKHRSFLRVIKYYSSLSTLPRSFGHSAANAGGVHVAWARKLGRAHDLGFNWLHPLVTQPPVEVGNASGTWRYSTDVAPHSIKVHGGASAPRARAEPERDALPRFPASLVSLTPQASAADVKCPLAFRDQADCPLTSDSQTSSQRVSPSQILGPWGTPRNLTWTPACASHH